MNKFDLILRKGEIVTEQGTSRGDIAIKNGKIAEIAADIAGAAGDEEIDATGLHILPGLIDVHVHLNEPGRTEWEGIATGSQSLAAGGVTTFFDMPLNSDPPTICREAFFRKKELADEKAMIDYGILGGLVPDNLENLHDLHECGAIGFKAFMSNSGIKEFSHVDDISLLAGLKIISQLDSVAMLHAESQAITSYLGNEAVKAGRVSPRDYEASRPVISEIEAVEKAMAMAEVTKCKVHIVHASSSEVVKRVQQAKERGIDATVETCPHYLSLTVEDIEKWGAIAKCSPPVHNKEAVESLWQAVFNQEVDMVASDHSPSSPELKEITKDKNIFTAWGGISSAQSTLNVLLEEGYWRRGLPLEAIVRLTAANPAKRFGIYPKKGKIAVGSDADFVIVDLNQSFVLKKEDLLYKHPVSPFIGKKFRGKILYTLLRGKKVFAEGKAISGNIQGQMVKKV